MTNWWFTEGQKGAELEFSRRPWWYERETIRATPTSAGWQITPGPVSLGQAIRGRFTFVEASSFDTGSFTLGV